MDHSGVARMPPSELESKVAHGLRATENLVPTAVLTNMGDGQNGRVYASGFGSGGIYASANDLLRWHRVLNGAKLLNRCEQATTVPSEFEQLRLWMEGKFQ